MNEVQETDNLAGTFAKFGDEYPVKLLNQIIGVRHQNDSGIVRDCKFGKSLMSIVGIEHFGNEYSKYIIKIILDYYSEYRSIPFYNTIKAEVRQTVSREDTQECVIEYLKEVESCIAEDWKWVQESSQKFIIQQNVINLSQQLLQDAKMGKDLSSCVTRLKDATTLNAQGDGPMIVSAGDYSDMEEGRNPVGTGFEHLDHDLNGGVSAGELALVIAGTGAGKSTLFSKMANNAFNAGYKVIQIYFEDKNSQIMAKHRSCWTGIGLREIFKVLRKDRREKYKDTISMIHRTSDKKIKKGMDKGGQLILKRFDTGITTVGQIEEFINEITYYGYVNESDGKLYRFKPDIIFVDYIECIKPEGNYQKGWEGEPEIMRSLERLAGKNGLNIPIWTATQGGRGAMNNHLVTETEGGGAFAKSQIAHIILTLSKTLANEQANTANVAIRKSRVGGAGTVYSDTPFNNEAMDIQMLRQTQEQQKDYVNKVLTSGSKKR